MHFASKTAFDPSNVRARRRNWGHRACFLKIVLAAGALLPQCDRIPGEMMSFTQTGIAGSYSNQHHGSLTASGEPYNRHAYTAAHATLPLGTILWVKNLDTGREEKVRINDRPPSAGALVLRLSSKAALNLGMASEAAPVAFAITRASQNLQASTSQN